MKTIELNKGLVAIVDDDQFPELAQYRWRVSSNGYATRTENTKPKQKYFYMHRVVLGCSGASLVDHINGNRLDNRACNLRAANQSENMMNRGKTARNKSGFKGVAWHKRSGKWCAAIRKQGKTHHLGLFADPLDAARAYDRSVSNFHGAFAKPNFPFALS